ncbi:MAG: hypothetical protein ACEQSA_02125 [Weeksellaceae bacterium]
MKKHLITIRNLFAVLFVLAFAVVALVLNMKVHPQGVPYYQVVQDRHVGGPFESSGSTSRYALVQALAENGTFYFDKTLASFASPDVGGSDRRYYTIFAPGVSMAGYPLYMLGSMFGYEQFTTYLLNVIFAIGCLALIMAITRRYGLPLSMQIVAGLTYIFATNAVVYSLYLTQHIMSTFCVLAGVLITLYKPNIIRNILLGLLFGAGLLIDVPNAFLMLPIVVYQFFRHFSVTHVKEYFKINMRFIFVAMLVGLIPLLMFFGYYNKDLTGNPTLPPQFVGRTIEVEKTVDTPQPVVKKEAEKFDDVGDNSPFVTRLMLNGLYILLISDERGWMYYSPILLIGIIGMYFVYKNKDLNEILTVPLSVVLINILLYSMFGDHWGGWSFGARYLIPGAAMVALFIPFAIVKWRKNIIMLLITAILIGYSVFVSMLGAATTTGIPPKQEAENLSTKIPYTYEYNYQLIENNQSYSLINTYLLKDTPAKTMWIIESSVITGIIILITGYYSVTMWKRHNA